MQHSTDNTFNTNSTRQHTDVLRRLENDERKKALAAKLEAADENEKVHYTIQYYSILHVTTCNNITLPKLAVSCNV
jgi:hypothetical protein